MVNVLIKCYRIHNSVNTAKGRIFNKIVSEPPYHLLPLAGKARKSERLHGPCLLGANGETRVIFVKLYFSHMASTSRASLRGVQPV